MAPTATNPYHSGSPASSVAISVGSPSPASYGTTTGGPNNAADGSAAFANHGAAAGAGGDISATPSSRYYRFVRGSGPPVASSFNSFKSASAAAGNSNATPMHRYRQMQRERRIEAVRREKEAARLALGLQVRRKRFCLRAFLDFIQFGCGVCVWPLFLIAFLALLLIKVNATVAKGEEVAAAIALITPSPSPTPTLSATITPSPTINSGSLPNNPTLTPFPTVSPTVEEPSPTPYPWATVAAGPSWWVVFAPFVAFLVWPALCACCGLLTVIMEEIAGTLGGDNGRRKKSCCARLWRCLCCFPAGSETSAWVDQADADTHNFTAFGKHVVKGCCNGSSGAGRCIKFSINLFVFVCMVALPLSIASKLQAGDGVGLLGTGSSTPWGVVLLPLWLGLTACLCVPCTGILADSDDSDAGELVGGMGGGSLVIFIIITFAVICAILGGKAIALKYAFIPFWFLDIAVVLSASMGLIISCCTSNGWCARGPTSSDAKAMSVAATLALLTFGGIGVGQAFASYYWEENDVRGVARSLLIPILLVASVGACLVCIASCFCLSEARKKAFKPLYQTQWWKTESQILAAVPKGTAAMTNAYRNVLQESGFESQVVEAATAGRVAATLYRTNQETETGVRVAVAGEGGAVGPVISAPMAYRGGDGRRDSYERSAWDGTGPPPPPPPAPNPLDRSRLRSASLE